MAIRASANEQLVWNVRLTEEPESRRLLLNQGAIVRVSEFATRDDIMKHVHIYQPKTVDIPTEATHLLKQVNARVQMRGYSVHINDDNKIVVQDEDIRIEPIVIEEGVYEREDVQFTIDESGLHVESTAQEDMAMEFCDIFISTESPEDKIQISVEGEPINLEWDTSMREI